MWKLLLRIWNKAGAVLPPTLFRDWAPNTACFLEVFAELVLVTLLLIVESDDSDESEDSSWWLQEKSCLWAFGFENSGKHWSWSTSSVSSSSSVTWKQQLGQSHHKHSVACLSCFWPPLLTTVDPASHHFWQFQQKHQERRTHTSLAHNHPRAAVWRKSSEFLTVFLASFAGWIWMSRFKLIHGLCISCFQAPNSFDFWWSGAASNLKQKKTSVIV